MRIACVQFAPALLDRAETERRLEPLLARAAAADLVVLPELCNSGYEFESEEEAARCAEPVADSAFLTFLQARAAQHDLAIVTGFCERDRDTLWNSAVLVDADGPRTTDDAGGPGVYRKLHLFQREKEWFAPGDHGVPILEWRGLRLAMLVCFDWAFPEVWRLAALGGADLVAHPANFVLTGFAQRAVPVHAITNRFFVATANRVGEERTLRFTGRSLLVGPRGEALAEAPEEGAAVVEATIDPALARDKAITERNDVLGDRRPELYGPLTTP